MADLAVETDCRAISSTDTASLFPLPLTPFERFMVLDDRPRYPMTFFGELGFIGRLSTEALDAALASALARHALLDARLARHSGRFCWVPTNGTAPTVENAPTADNDAACFDAAIDLRSSAGLRLRVRQAAQGSILALQFHHACCDGLGAMQLIEDLLIGYAQLTAAPNCRPEFRLLDPLHLRRRGDFADPSNTTNRVRVSAWQQLRESWRFHACRPDSLASRGSATRAPANDDVPGTHSHWFDRRESSAIQAAVARRGSTLNDLALSLLLHTLAAWNLAQHVSPRGCLRILVPTDLRTRHDLRLPAANRMSFSFITRSYDDCGDGASLLAGVRHETQQIRTTRQGLDFLAGITMLQSVPGLFPLLLNLPQCLATAVLTSMSDPTRRFRDRLPLDDGRLVVGDVILDRITGSPPLRPGTRAGFGVGSYAGRIVLNARCDPWRFTDADTAALFAQYVAAWHNWLADK